MSNGAKITENELESLEIPDDHSALMVDNDGVPIQAIFANQNDDKLTEGGSIIVAIFVALHEHREEFIDFLNTLSKVQEICGTTKSN